MKLLTTNGPPVEPMLPNKPRSVARANERRGLNGIFWVLRSGGALAGPPEKLRSIDHHNRFVRWRRAAVWGKSMNALAGAHDAAVQMIDTSFVRVHQHGCLHHSEQMTVDGPVTRRFNEQDSRGRRCQPTSCSAGADSR
jgi:transposase